MQFSLRAVLSSGRLFIRLHPEGLQRSAGLSIPSGHGFLDHLLLLAVWWFLVGISAVDGFLGLDGDRDSVRLRHLLILLGFSSVKNNSFDNGHDSVCSLTFLLGISTGKGDFHVGLNVRNSFDGDRDSDLHSAVGFLITSFSVPMMSDPADEHERGDLECSICLLGGDLVCSRNLVPRAVLPSLSAHLFDGGNFVSSLLLLIFFFW